MRYYAALGALVVGGAAIGSAPAATIRTLSIGSTFTVTGQTGSLPGETARATGKVLVRKSWDGTGLVYFTMARTDSHGRYRVTITPRRRGLLTLSITPPDKHAVQYHLRVV